jgi:hypothetical protein
MDVAIRTYLYKLDGNSFQESYSLNLFLTLDHTVGSVPHVIRTNKEVIQNTLLLLIQTVIVINEIYFNQRKIWFQKLLDIDIY